MLRILLSIAAIALLGACASEPVRDMQAKMQNLFQSSKGEPALAAGVKQYEEGEYPGSAKNLRAAIDQGLSNKDLARAYKYLAFIDCSSSRERQCRDQFRKALAVDPGFELAPAEAGHPVWGPIFRSLKAGAPQYSQTAGKGQPALVVGLKQYEEGEYDDSAKNLQGAIEQGLPGKEQVSAHKHLAFIHCASSRERQCREEFRKALALDPALELAPAEAGHPVWGPIFRSLKADR